MDVTISFGWWLAPLAVTILAFGYAIWDGPSSARPSYADAVIALIEYGAALIVSLIAWLVWALLT